jgi:hypothetical protein
VDKKGFREVLAIKVAGCGKSAAYTLGVFPNQTSAQIISHGDSAQERRGLVAKALSEAERARDNEETYNPQHSRL